MFNFLVKGNAWAAAGDTIPSGRIFEYTDQSLINRFKPKGRLDLTALMALPTLFVEETYGQGDQVARVGTIVRAKINGRVVSMEYVYDPGVPPIPNRFLQTLAGELDIHDFQFTRTHWSVKDADLFRTLLRNMQPRRNRPTVFQLADPEAIEPTLVSVMMPFHPDFNRVYKVLLRTAKNAGLHCRRADDIWENPAVIQDVVSLIDRSHIIICDCSTRNPNVFYEIGIAHTLGREVILITQSDEDIPFDLRHLRYVPYLNNREGLTALAARLKPRLEALLA
ncbi:MAG: hypothetical protein ACHQ0Y_04840 [Thermodesulfovibrionales bacterium]